MLKRLEWHRLFQQQKYQYFILINTLLSNLQANDIPATVPLGAPPEFVKQYNRRNGRFHTTKNLRLFMQNAQDELKSLKFVTLNVAKRLGIVRGLYRLAFSVDGVMYTLYEVREAYDDNNQEGIPRVFVLKRMTLKDCFYAAGAYAPAITTDKCPVFREPALFCTVGLESNAVIQDNEMITKLLVHALMRGNIYGEWTYGTDDLQKRGT